MWKDAVERDQTHGPAGSTDTGVGARRKRGGAERALRGVAEDPLQMAGALSGARHRGVGGEEPGAASLSTRHPPRSKRSHRDPLTLTDAHRRYRLRCQIVPNTDTVPTTAARKQQDGFTPFSRSTITGAPQGLDHLTPAACYTGSPRSMPRRWAGWMDLDTYFIAA